MDIFQVGKKWMKVSQRPHVVKLTVGKGEEVGGHSTTLNTTEHAQRDICMFNCSNVGPEL